MLRAELSIDNIFLQTHTIFGILSNDFSKNSEKFSILSMLNLHKKSARFSEVGIV